MKGLKTLIILMVYFTTLKSEDIVSITDTIKIKENQEIIPGNNDGVVTKYEMIPYAVPPINEKRFKAPESLPANYTYDNFKKKEIDQCVYITLDGNVRGYEDCLYLDVHIHNQRSEKEFKPVFVVFADMYFNVPLENVQTTEIFKAFPNCCVFVIVRYRLGVFGFLQTYNQFVTSGNMGLKDQVKALEWVQAYIQKFGGDPDFVTLMGFQGGAAAAHLHLFSELSQGLFRRIYASSGNIFSPWALIPHMQRRSFAFVEKSGCLKDTSAAVRECLQSKNLVEILNTYKTVCEWTGKDKIFPYGCLGPTVDERSEQPFLRDHPIALIDAGRFNYRVPIIFGFSKNEGKPLPMYFLQSNGDYKINDVPFDIPHLYLYRQFMKYDGYPEENQTDVVNVDKDAFIKKISEVYGESTSEQLGDRLIYSGLSKAIKSNSRYGCSFILSFDHKFNHNTNRGEGLFKFEHSGSDFLILFNPGHNYFENLGNFEPDNFNLDLERKNLFRTILIFGRSGLVKSTEWYLKPYVPAHEFNTGEAFSQLVYNGSTTLIVPDVKDVIKAQETWDKLIPEIFSGVKNCC